jgi:hypothetical protein
MVSGIDVSLETALEESKAALAKAERRRAELEVEVQSLQTEVAGIEAALKRRRESSNPSIFKPASGVFTPTTFATPAFPDTYPVVGLATLVLLLMDLHNNWTNKKRATAVESVLQVANKPIHRTDITDALGRLGRVSDTLESVSAALAYLNRSGRARPIGDGYWEVGKAAMSIPANVIT